MAAVLCIRYHAILVSFSFATALFDPNRNRDMSRFQYLVFNTFLRFYQFLSFVRAHTPTKKVPPRPRTNQQQHRQISIPFFVVVVVVSSPLFGLSWAKFINAQWILETLAGFCMQKTWWHHHQIVCLHRFCVECVQDTWLFQLYIYATATAAAAAAACIVYIPRCCTYRACVCAEHSCPRWLYALRCTSADWLQAAVGIVICMGVQPHRNRGRTL